MLVKIVTALQSNSFSWRLMRSIKLIWLLPFGDSETITSSVFLSIANKLLVLIVLKLKIKISVSGICRLNWLFCFYTLHLFLQFQNIEPLKMLIWWCLYFRRSNWFPLFDREFCNNSYQIYFYCISSKATEYWKQYFVHRKKKE